MYALIDCDNFFVSCERIFQPNLKNRPLVVLSNNDGCVVSRSDEAKALDIPMGIPYFKIEKFLKNSGGEARSSNYELYADISQRIMSLIRQEFGNLEIYSIDEAFVQISTHHDFVKQAIDFHHKVMQYIGVSVSIGIASSKTLCKIAADYAKKHQKVYFLSESQQISQHLQQLDVIKVWGVGRNTARKLNFIGIFTAEELRQSPLPRLRKTGGINLEKTALELNGTPCIYLHEEENQKSILCSRSFEHEIASLSALEPIIAEFVDSACLRLRQQNALAHSICLFISSNLHNQLHRQYQNSIIISLPSLSDNTAAFLRAMHIGLQQIFRSDILYKRAGISLLGLQNRQHLQQDLLLSSNSDTKEHRLMQAFDSINRKLGKKSIYFGIQNPVLKYYIRRSLKSSSYTTSWDGLALVK